MRVLIVMPAQWPRALIRAALLDAGYDALGAPDLDGALTYPADEPGRGPVRLIILDQRAVQDQDDHRLRRLRERYPEAETVLLRRAFQPRLPGRWRDVVQHPVSIAELTEKVRQLLPSPPPQPIGTSSPSEPPQETRVDEAPGHHAQ